MTKVNRIVADAEYELMEALDIYINALMDEDEQIKDRIERILELQTEENEEKVNDMLFDITSAAARVAVDLLVKGKR